MDDEVFYKEEQKLNEILQKMKEEEQETEEYLSNSNMSFKLDDIARANVIQAQIKKLADIKKIKDILG